jgi:hypothetical protein
LRHTWTLLVGISTNKLEVLSTYLLTTTVPLASGPIPIGYTDLGVGVIYMEGEGLNLYTTAGGGMGFALHLISADAAVNWIVKESLNSYNDLSGNAAHAQVSTPIGTFAVTGSYSASSGVSRLSYVGVTVSAEITKASALMRPLSTILDAASPFSPQIGCSYTILAWQK